MTTTSALNSRLSVSLASLLVLTLSGCASAGTGDNVSGATEFGHVHGLGIDGSSGVVYVATHNGVWELPPIGSETVKAAELEGPISGRAQDTMGFTMVDDRMLASGHPDPAEHPDLMPPNLGLIESYDNAKTWTPISLWGETDFHDVSAVRQPTGTLTVYGYDASTGTVWFSSDSGRTWVTGATVALRDLVAVPSEAGTLYATTEAGLMVSADNGVTFSVVPDAPILYLVEASDTGALVGVDLNGAVWTRPADGEWSTQGAVEGEVEAIAFRGDTQTLVAYDSRGVVVSDDFGATWDLLLSR